MSFFKINKEVAANQESTGGDYLSKSGIYPITLKFVSVDINNHNARSLNFNIDYKGNPTTLYGLKLDNNDGSENYQASVFNRLCNVLEIDAVSNPEIEEHAVGKDSTPKEFSVLPDFTDKEVAIRVQEEYSKYNGEIKKRLVIKNFYRYSDGASAAEIINGDASKFGQQLAKDKPYAENVTYRDGLTEADIKAWKASQSSGGSSAAPAAQVTKPAANPFA